MLSFDILYTYIQTKCFCEESKWTNTFQCYNVCIICNRTSHPPISHFIIFTLPISRWELHSQSGLLVWCVVTDVELLWFQSRLLFCCLHLWNTFHCMAYNSIETCWVAFALNNMKEHLEHADLNPFATPSPYSMSIRIYSPCILFKKPLFVLFFGVYIFCSISSRRFLFRLIPNCLI